MDGGIRGLLGLIHDHRGAIEYDFRQRFGLGLADIGTRLSVTEAARLALVLLSDPASRICAAFSEWLESNPEEPKPVRHGDAAGRSPDEVKAILRSQFGQQTEGDGHG